MINILDGKKISQDLIHEGFSVINNYLNNDDIELIKKTLFNALDYIKKDDCAETNSTGINLHRKSLSIFNVFYC